METINQYLTFRMRDEEYALCVSGVKEILEVPRITRIPRMPPFMTGVINLRGAVVPVIDLRRKFGMGDTVVAPETAIIVVEIPTCDERDEILTLGIFADAVQKVVTFEREEIMPPPRIGLRIDTSFIAGMGQIDARFVTILNIAEILSKGELDEARIAAGTGAQPETAQAPGESAKG